MLEWSERFETQIDIVDTQHKNLVSLLNQLCQEVEAHTLTEESLNEVLAQLMHYAEQHFSDEEQLMEENKLSEKHLQLHKMEHRSFIYDIERMHNYFSPDHNIVESGEKLVEFIVAWLTYHILGMDKMMAGQIADIKLGIQPEKAYELYKTKGYDITTTRLMLKAVLKMWKQSNEHCYQLEEQLARCLNEKNHSSI